MSKAQDPESIPSKLDSAFPDFAAQLHQVLFRNHFELLNQLKHPRYLLPCLGAQRIEEFFDRAPSGRRSVESNRSPHRNKLARVLTYVKNPDARERRLVLLAGCLPAHLARHRQPSSRFRFAYLFPSHRSPRRPPVPALPCSKVTRPQERPISSIDPRFGENTLSLVSR